MKSISFYFLRRQKAILLCLLLSLTSIAQAQELVLYAIPSKKEISWKSPGSLLRGYLKNIMTKSKYKGYGHPMGHIIVALESPERCEVMGMVAEKVSELGNKVALDGYGMGVMYTASQGILREGAKNIEDLHLHYPDGDVAYIRFKLNDATFNRLWQYYTEYKQYGFDKIYNGLNKPREGKGAGCSAYGVSFIEVADLLPKEVLDQWQMKVNVPEKLIGGPHREDKWVGLLRVLLKGKWADTTKEAYRELAYYEPSVMYQWIVSSWEQEQIAHIGTVAKENRGRSRGIVIDRTTAPVPYEPIWQLEPAGTNIVAR